jgi:hypothetical protein
MDERRDQLTFFIMENKRGPNQVGAGVSAVGFGSMAKGAVGRVEFLATLGGNGIGRRAESKEFTRADGSGGLSGERSGGEQEDQERFETRRHRDGQGLPLLLQSY